MIMVDTAKKKMMNNNFDNRTPPVDVVIAFAPPLSPWGRIKIRGSTRWGSYGLA